MKLDYTPVVHVQVVKDVRKKEIASNLPAGLASAVLETGQYAVKDTDYLTGNEDNDVTVVADLEKGLYKKRMIGWGNSLKEIHKQLNLNDIEDGDLILVDDEDSDGEVKAYSIVAQWNWKAQNYFIR